MRDQRIHWKTGEPRLDDSVVLWRYMSLPKYLSLLHAKALWLARADTLSDKQEGRFPQDFRSILEHAYEKQDVGQNTSGYPPRNGDEFQDYLRMNTFISCWHMNDADNFLMWELYGGPDHCLAIKTTVADLKASLLDSRGKLPKIRPPIEPNLGFILDKIEYKSQEQITGEEKYERYFYYKRPHFKFEREARLSLDTYAPWNPVKPTVAGLQLPIFDLDRLINQVLVHPDSSDWFLEAVKDVTDKYKINRTLVDRAKHGNNQNS